MALLVALIPSSSETLPSVQALAEDARSRWGATVAERPSDGPTIAFNWNGIEMVAASMPEPIPWSDLEYLAGVSRLWPDASGTLRNHTSHIVLTAMAEAKGVLVDLEGTKAVASLLSAAPDTLGVYTGTPLLIRKDIYVDYASRVVPASLPIDLWVDIQVGGSATARAAGYTRGLDGFGHLEFEAPAAGESSEQLYDRLWFLAGYVLEHGPVIKDGDTIGSDASEHIKVVVSESSFGLPGQVMTLEYA